MKLSNLDLKKIGLVLVLVIIGFVWDPVFSSAVLLSAAISFAFYKYVKRIVDAEIEKYFSK